MSHPKDIPFSMLDRLRSRLGREAIVTNTSERTLYSCDGLRFHTAMPGCVVIPESTDDVRFILGLCTEFEIPFTARGAGTGLSGGAVIDGGLILQMSRMNSILKLDAENRLAVVQPGVINSHLSQAAGRYGLHFAPDPSSQLVSTIGGNVAENAGGPHTLKYGVTTDHILGQTVVLPDGEILNLGGTHRYQPGMDLSGYFTGSEGTLGVTTEIIVNLTPNPGTLRTFLLVFDELSKATDCVSAIIADGIVPTAMELMEELAIQAVEAKLKPGFPPDAAAILIVELDDLNTDIQADALRLKQIIQPFLSAPLQEAEDAAAREKLWRGRKHAAGSLGQISKAYYTNDGVVPRDQLTEIFRRIAAVAREYNVRIASFCHAGDGNIHPNVLYDPKDPDQVQRAQQASVAILHHCMELGGTITGEHGVGLEKRNELPLKHSLAEIYIFKEIKSLFDPLNIANPGKIFPEKDPDETAEIMLSLPSENGIIRHMPGNLTLTVSGDARLSNVQSRLKESRQFLALGPFDDSTTVRDIIDHNMVGRLSDQYGLVRNQLLNAKVETGVGVIQTGADVMKNVSGYDLNKLIIGAAGSLGRVIEATFRIYPIQENSDDGDVISIMNGSRILVPPAELKKLMNSIRESGYLHQVYANLGIIDIRCAMDQISEPLSRQLRDADAAVSALEKGRAHFPQMIPRQLASKIKLIFDPNHQFPDGHE